MASPQLNNGYTKLAHELLRAVYRFPFTGMQGRLVMWAFRDSYGWGQKQTHPMSLTKLTNELGPRAARSSVAWALKTLAAAGVLDRDAKGVCRINKNYDEWVIQEAGRLPLTARRAPKGKVARAAAPPVAAFEIFWTAYPRKHDRRRAATAWARLAPAAALAATIARALAAQRETDQWRRGVIPSPANWLRDARWEDEVPGAPPPAPKAVAPAPRAAAAARTCGLCPRPLGADDTTVCKDCGHFCRKCDKKTPMLAVRRRVDKTMTALCGKCTLRNRK